MATLLTIETAATAWPFKGAEAAIFDFDGTIADSLGVWQQVDDIFFARRGLTYRPDYPEILSILGFEEGAQYTIKTYGLNDTPQAVCNEWNELGRELYRTSVQLRKGAQTYVEHIKGQGIKVALATTNRPYVLEAVQPRIDLDDLFPVRVYGCDVTRPTKQDPDIYLECAARLGVDPSKCVVFEDIPTGIRTARSIGMATVAVVTDYNQPQRHAFEIEADYILETWEALT